MIRPLQLVLDFFLILGTLFVIADSEFLNILFASYIILFWGISSFFTRYYKVYRYTKLLRVFTLIFRQSLIFTLGFFAFFGLFKEGYLVHNQFKVFATILSVTIASKFLVFFLLKAYRRIGKNYRKVIILGMDNSTERIKNLFQNQKNLGYDYVGFFSDKSQSKKLGNLKESYNFILENSIDEIYCSLKELDKKTLKEVTIFANTNDVVIKLIPETDKLYSKNRSIEFYDDSLAIYNVPKLPFEFYENYLIKRLFDMVFSLFVCIFIMTWLTPILWILIKLESRGTAIFKQKREGLNAKQFVCYKFRSMKQNKLSDKVHTTLNDSRVTKLGGFLRKTSMDELPQFFNVLRGDMSVVGPRPHLKSLSEEYQKNVDDYMRRHLVKPGITGLAQVSGYRGEVKKRSDIKNRVRLDIFYIENWSFLLDIKIILMTIFNVFKGEDKAY